jgi:hypothetical protein
MPRRIVSLFRNLLRKHTVEQALDDELRSSVEILAEEKMKDGLSSAVALRQARIELGGVEQVKEEVRAIRVGNFLENFTRDLRLAFRTLAKAPPPQMFSNGIAVWPEALCESLVDDHYLRLVRRIVLGEIAALAQRNLHRPKIIRACDANIHLQLLPWGRSVTFHVDTSPTYLARQRQCRNHSFRDHPWEWATRLSISL